ncbi:hypothetical protein BRC62_03085 [Halobacteriales archaeon QH_10_67_13]|nr:MAG: hypothetical protein BRC62_03085 [Halobacteriales archaeon QH_10_67_13]
MLTIDLEKFAFELDEGAIKHVGASSTTASASLYDVASLEVREFGDDRVKLAFADEDGNDLEVALFPDQLDGLLERASDR